MSDGEYRGVIRELPEGERPRERLQHYGEGALSTAELVAIALVTGSRGENAIGLAQRLLSTFGSLGGLARASLPELRRVPGVGLAKASQIKASLELGRRLSYGAEANRPQITRPDDAAQLFMASMTNLVQEQMHVMLLDTRHRVQRVELLYKGNLNTSVVRVAEVFCTPIKESAAAIIVGHNHPSGDPTPSPEDVRVTEAIVRAGTLLDIGVLDHLIIGARGFVSLKERGLGGF